MERRIFEGSEHLSGLVRGLVGLSVLVIPLCFGLACWAGPSAGIQAALGTQASADLPRNGATARMRLPHRRRPETPGR